MVCAPGQNGVRPRAKWCARPGKMMCAADKMVCAHFGCNGRPWENDVRVGVRVDVRVDVRADGWGACSAAHIIFVHAGGQGWADFAPTITPERIASPRPPRSR